MRIKKIIVFGLALFIVNTLHGQVVLEEYYRLTKKADSLFKSGNYKQSAFTYSDAFKMFGWRGFLEHRYSAACAWAISGYPDSAIFNLERIAYKVAYSDITRVSNEKFFSNLHSHMKWKPLLLKIQLNSDSIAAVAAKLDKALIKKLDSLVVEDQKWRNLVTRIDNNAVPKDSIDMKTIYKNWKKSDSLNTFEARRIFYKYGFPNFDLVGRDGSGNFWLLIQHQDRFPVFQDSVLTAMKIEAEKGKASWQNYAYLVDRVKINTGKLQIYGTQMQLNTENTSYEPKPVIEPEKLNDRRKSVGLGTIEEYTKTMNTRYFGTLKKK